MQMYKRLIGIALLVPILAFIIPQKKITIFMAGDSTMSVKSPQNYPETGWGMPFVYFWKDGVKVINLARNGRSTGSFIKEGLWKKITDSAEAGDYVFIQFGHNDEVPTKRSATTPSEFEGNLRKFVNESRAKKAIPVLLTPVARRKFDEQGNVVGTHDQYSQIVREVASGMDVPLIDLDKEAQALYQKLGDKYSKMLFMHLKPGEHPNYPNGREDDTHFNELGARDIAEIVLKNIREKVTGLVPYIVVRDRK